MKNKFLLLSFSFLFSIISFNSWAINYVSSSAGPADWHTSTSWTPNGIPTSADNVTISAGHTITVAAVGSCADLTVQGTISFFSVGNINISGNYTVNGSELGSGNINFSGVNSPTKSISGTGTFSTNMRWVFVRNRNIASNVTATRVAKTRINSNIVVRNSGNMGIRQTELYSGCSWINEAGSTLSINTDATFFTGIYQNIGTFDCSAVGNTVIINSANIDLPNTVSGYYNLTLSFPTSGVKKLAANTVVLNNLTINSSNTLNSNGFDLSVGGNWVKNGLFIASTGKTVTFNGTVAQTISGTGTTTFKGLAINNTAGVTLSSGTYILDEVLTVSNGTFNTNGRSFTMTSTAAQTARIAPITGTGAISGSFIIQRFITTRVATWADMASPVQASTFADWDAELPARYYVYAPPASYPTQYSYSEPLDDFVAITTNTTALTPGKGYEVFLSADYNYADLPNTTLTTLGTPNQGDQNLSSLVSFSNAGSNLVGNPFASSISWNSVLAASSNLSGTYDVFDYTVGNYSTFGAGTEIGAGQGFWVYSTGAPTLIINESAKTTSANSSLRNMNAIQPYFMLDLTNNNSKYSHTIKFAANNTASNGFDMNEDHPFRKSPVKEAPSITCSIDGKKSVINTFNSYNEEYSIPLEVNSILNGTFTIDAKGLEFVGDYSCVVLEDVLLNNFINLNEQSSYTFSYNTNDSKNRFILHFSKNGDCKSMISAAPIANNIENNIQILQNTNGNTVYFNFDETYNTTISVTNILGQNIIENLSVQASNQSVFVALPENFNGVYIIKVENQKGAVVKKFIK